jgi:hypothetical protein
MKTQRFILLVCLPVLFLFSCTIEKRVHLPGYHIESARHGSVSKKQRTDEAQKQLPVRTNNEEQTVLPRREPVLASAAEQPQLSVLPAEKVAPVEGEVAVVPAESGKLPAQVRESNTPHHIGLPEIRLPGSEKQLQRKTERSEMSQADSRNRAGLLLAPLRIIFTLLLIALVIVGVVMLFVLESALGGTVLLAAGAVLLILILL